MSFRETPVDDPVAAALLDEYFDGRAETFPAGPDAYVRTMPKRSDFTPPHGVFLLVEDEIDGVVQAVGCGGIRSVSPAPDGAPRHEVKHLFTQPRTRGRGLGAALLAELERRAVALGAREIVLDTNASQAAAARLYERTGYQQIEPYNDNPNASHWYRKVL